MGDERIEPASLGDEEGRRECDVLAGVGELRERSAQLGAVTHGVTDPVEHGHDALAVDPVLDESVHAAHEGVQALGAGLADDHHEIGAGGRGAG